MIVGKIYTIKPRVSHTFCINGKCMKIKKRINPLMNNGNDRLVYILNTHDLSLHTPNIQLISRDFLPQLLQHHGSCKRSFKKKKHVVKKKKSSVVKKKKTTMKPKKKSSVEKKKKSHMKPKKKSSVEKKKKSHMKPKKKKKTSKIK